MKNSIILSIIFILGIHGIHAGTPEFISKKISGNTIEITINLNPVAPQTFSVSDAIRIQFSKDHNLSIACDIPASIFAEQESEEFLESVAPVTPKEATFDDESPASSSVSDPLAPTTPRYASFDD